MWTGKAVELQHTDFKSFYSRSLTIAKLVI